MTNGTPHIQPNGTKIAKTVLMPGDPLRAKYIADNFLENVEQFNEVRNMFGYTGTYKGKEISVMGSWVFQVLEFIRMSFIISLMLIQLFELVHVVHYKRM